MRVGVLVSGSGSILSALIKSGINICVVISDRPCVGLDIATSYGIATELIERKSYDRDFDRNNYTNHVVEKLHLHQVELVAMAGFMTILGEPIFEAFSGKVLNTHPALLPSFKGAHAVEASLAAGVKLSGCTVHIATPQVDAGPILAQEAVPVFEQDTPASLHERIKEVERRLYPKCILEISQGGHVL